MAAEQIKDNFWGTTNKNFTTSAKLGPKRRKCIILNFFIKGMGLKKMHSSFRMAAVQSSNISFLT